MITHLTIKVISYFYDIIIYMESIYNYIDQNGISFKKLDSYSIKVQDDDIINRIYLEHDESAKEVIKKGELIFSRHQHPNLKVPNLPYKFDLDQTEQENIIIKWLEDTTGYVVDEFKTLFELPVLNGNPFLLQVERGYSNFFLLLATKKIYGDLIIREKFHKHHGFIQENFIDTFGQIVEINGNLGIDGKMQDFGNLVEVSGDLWFSNHVYQSNLETLSPLKKVGGTLNLKNSHACLSSIEEIGGNLNLRKTNCYDISSLKRVGGNILLSRSQSDNFDFSNVEIGGTKKIYNDKFENHLS